MHDIRQILAQAKTLHRANCVAEAEQLYRLILATDAEHIEARYLLAAAKDALGLADEAVAHLEEVLRRVPDHAEAHNRLGAILAEREKFDEATAHFEAAVRLRPGFASAQANLQNAIVARHHQSALALVAEGKLEQAGANYRAALAVRPDDFAAHGNLGNVLKLQGKLEEAESCYRRMLELAPDSAEAHYSLGAVSVERFAWAEAAALFHRAIELNPQYSAAFSGLGRTLLEQGDLPGALPHYRRGVELAPDSPDAHFHLAFALLLDGQFGEGWQEYEWRLKRKGFGEPVLREPRWIGSPLPGKTILVHCEQGFGDTLQFMRFVELLKRQSATVVVECRTPMAALLARCAGVDRVAVRGQPRPPFDCHVPLASLPGILGISLADIPARVPYLAPAEATLEMWRGRLADERAFKIGIVWQGNREHAYDRLRSIPLAHFRGIAATAGVKLYSLQVGIGREQLAEVAAAWPITDLAEQLTDFQETAAVMQCLDLVVTCDSSPAHLAGALGVPVWVALPFAPDWRWMLEREDSPWYPTMRLFRQTKAGDWDAVFRRIKQELARLV